ncbi:MAG: acyl carrier protein [Acidobacteriaceae bacterium]|nr:acyl carrier protein [Acidobacteriaceae bacterium]
MDETKTRLIRCFETVFPDLTAEDISTAAQSSVAAWDSIAAITLLNVLEDEFGITMDLELAGELDSFSKIYEYLKTTAVNA